MQVEFKESFKRDLKIMRQGKILKRIAGVINEVEKAKDIFGIRKLKKLQAKGNYYRITVGDYRLGLTIKGNKATLVRFLHRKEIYRYYP